MQEGPSLTYATCGPSASRGPPLRLISLWPLASSYLPSLPPQGPSRTLGLLPTQRGLQCSLQPSC